MENLDFSKPEDQEKFDLASPDDRQKIIEAAQTEANQLMELVNSGNAKDYSEALEQISESELHYKGFSIFIAPNGDMFLDIGGGRELMGNTLEGAVTENSEGTTIDVDTYNENLSRILKVIDAFILDKAGSDKIN